MPAEHSQDQILDAFHSWKLVNARWEAGGTGSGWHDRYDTLLKQNTDEVA